MRDLAIPRRNLHVLLTADVVGGVWDFCSVLASELIRTGHRVTLLVFGRPSPLHERQAAAIGAELLHAPLKLEWMQDSTADVLASRDLARRIAEQRRVDLLHANQYALGDLELDVPIVLTAHSDVLSWQKWNDGELRASPVCVDGPEARTGSQDPGEYATLVRRGLQAADAVVAVSGFLADEIRALYAVERPIRVIHNGWPSGRGKPRPVAERARLTLLAGRAWDSAKNVRLAAEAARDWGCGRVLLAGDQRHPETGSVMEFASPLQPLGRLSRDALDRLLGEARLYLAPARYEPFGLLPLQAALAGCPLLLSAIPSFCELWDGAALFFRPDDAADLRRQWRRLLDDDRLAADLASRAHQRALERYTPERMASEYLAVYAAVGRWELGVGASGPLSPWERAAGEGITPPAPNPHFPTPAGRRPA